MRISCLPLLVLLILSCGCSGKPQSVEIDLVSTGNTLAYTAPAPFATASIRRV